MAGYYNNWTSCKDPGVPQVPENILQASIAKLQAHVNQSTIQIKNLEAKIRATNNGAVGSSSRNIQAPMNALTNPFDLSGAVPGSNVQGDISLGNIFSDFPFGAPQKTLPPSANIN